MKGPIIPREDQTLSLADSQGAWRIVEMPPMVDIRDIGGIIKRKFLWLALIPLVTVGLALIYLFKFATLYYESRALVYIDPKFDRILQIENVTSIASDLDSLNSLEQAMVSDSMILRVIDKLNLRNDVTFLPKRLHKYAETENPMNGVRLIKYIKKRYRATLKRPTRNIEFVAYDTDAERAKLIAEAFLSEFETFLSQQKRKEADTAKTGLRAQAVIAEGRALNAEKELRAFREDNPGITVEQDHKLVSEELTNAGEELSKATAKVITLRSRIESIKDIDPRADPVKIITVGNFSALKHVSDLMSQRTTARANLAVASQQYTPRHPKYAEAANRVNEVDNQLAQLAGDLKTALVSDYTGALRNEAELKVRVSSLQSDLTGVKTTSSEFRAVQQKAETEWQIYQQLQQQIGDTTLSAERSTSITKLFSEPMLAYKTTKPKKSLVVIAAALLGMMGSCWLLISDLFRDGPFANKDQVEETMKSPVLAQVSRKDIRSENEKLTQAMAQIILTNQNPGCQIFHVMNAGKPTKASAIVAESLANTSAFYRAETILIKTYESGPQGIFHLCPVETDVKGLYQLDIPSSLLLTDNAWHVLSSKCKKFKRVIIDSSSMPADSQLPMYFGRYAQENIFVVDKKGDNKGHATKTADHFQSTCQRPVSVVLIG